MVLDPLWEKWTALQLECLQLLKSKEAPTAIRSVDRFLEDQEDPELRADILAFKAYIKEKIGDVEGAREELGTAQALTSPGTYRRYGVELSLCRLCEALGDTEGEWNWCIRALETVAGDPLSSGDAGVAHLLTLTKGRPLSEQERHLCEKVVRQAWQLFELPGVPDLNDLPSTLSELRMASARPLRRTQGSRRR